MSGTGTAEASRTNANEILGQQKATENQEITSLREAASVLKETSEMKGEATGAASKENLFQEK